MLPQTSPLSVVVRRHTAVKVPIIRHFMRFRHDAYIAQYVTKKNKRSQTDQVRTKTGMYALLQYSNTLMYLALQVSLLDIVRIAPHAVAAT